MSVKLLSSYYQALIDKKRCWFFVALLRSFEHLVLDRTIDKVTGRFEFFVSPDNEVYFVLLMKELEKQGLVSNFVKLDNRFS